MWVPVWEYISSSVSRKPSRSMVQAAVSRGGSVPGYTGISGVMQWVRSSIFMWRPPSLRPGVQPDHQRAHVRRGDPDMRVAWPRFSGRTAASFSRASSRSP